MTHSEDEADVPAGRMYLLVILCEIATVAALWACGRMFS